MSRGGSPTEAAVGTAPILYLITQHSEMSPGPIKTEVVEFLPLRIPWSEECLISI